MSSGAPGKRGGRRAGSRSGPSTRQRGAGGGSTAAADAMAASVAGTAPSSGGGGREGAPTNRRSRHNLAEQRRSHRISAQITELKALLQACDIPFKDNKYGVLRQATAFFRRLVESGLAQRVDVPASIGSGASGAAAAAAVTTTSAWPDATGAGHGGVEEEDEDFDAAAIDWRQVFCLSGALHALVELRTHRVVAASKAWEASAGMTVETARLQATPTPFFLTVASPASAPALANAVDHLGQTRNPVAHLMPHTGCQGQPVTSEVRLVAGTDGVYRHYLYTHLTGMLPGPLPPPAAATATVPPQHVGPRNPHAPAPAAVPAQAALQQVAPHMAFMLGAAQQPAPSMYFGAAQLAVAVPGMHVGGAAGAAGGRRGARNGAGVGTPPPPPPPSSSSSSSSSAPASSSSAAAAAAAALHGHPQQHPHQQVAQHTYMYAPAAGSSPAKPGVGGGDHLRQAAPQQHQHLRQHQHQHLPHHNMYQQSFRPMPTSVGMLALAGPMAQPQYAMVAAAPMSAPMPTPAPLPPPPTTTRYPAAAAPQPPPPPPQPQPQSQPQRRQYSASYGLPDAAISGRHGTPATGGMAAAAVAAAADTSNAVAPTAPHHHQQQQQHQQQYNFHQQHQQQQQQQQQQSSRRARKRPGPLTALAAAPRWSPPRQLHSDGTEVTEASSLARTSSGDTNAHYGELSPTHKTQPPRASRKRVTSDDFRGHSSPAAVSGGGGVASPSAGSAFTTKKRQRLA